MSDWNEEQSKYKAAKKGIVDQRPVPGHKKKPKVEKPWHVLWDPPWVTKTQTPWVLKRCATKQQAQAYIDKQLRSVYVSRQNRSERAWYEAIRSAAENAKRYSIKGPEE